MHKSSDAQGELTSECFWLKHKVMHVVFIITTVACQKKKIHASFNEHDFIDNYLLGRFLLLESVLDYYVYMSYGHGQHNHHHHSPD